jgi:hypothetical protein
VGVGALYFTKVSYHGEVADILYPARWGTVLYIEATRGQVANLSGQDEICRVLRLRWECPSASMEDVQYMQDRDQSRATVHNGQYPAP